MDRFEMPLGVSGTEQENSKSALSKKILETKNLLKGFSESFSSFNNGLKKTLMSAVVLLSTLPIVELSKKDSAQKDIESSKNLVKEYKLESSPKTYENNNGFVKKLDTAIKKGGEVFNNAYTVDLPEFFSKDGSTVIAYGENTSVGFRDKFNPEHFDTLSPEVLSKIIDETYPQGWFSTETDTLLISNKQSSTDYSEQYGNAIEAAAQFNRRNEKIDFFKYKSNFENSPEQMFFVLAHEAGHANDWYSSNSLNDDEKDFLYTQIVDRLDDPDRYISSYVEKHINTRDSAERVDVKATEYWAEICGEYFTNGRSNLSPKDVGLIEIVIDSKDLYFDIDQAIQKRLFIVRNLVYKQDSAQANEKTIFIENLFNLRKAWYQGIDESNELQNANSQLFYELENKGFSLWSFAGGKQIDDYRASGIPENSIFDEYIRIKKVREESERLLLDLVRGYNKNAEQKISESSINSKYEKI